MPQVEVLVLELLAVDATVKIRSQCMSHMHFVRPKLTSHLRCPVLCQPCVLARRKVVGMTYVAAGEVTTLEHELGDDAVEAGALVVEGLAALSSALLAGAESAEVLSGLLVIVSDCLILSVPRGERGLTKTLLAGYSPWGPGRRRAP